MTRKWLSSCLADVEDLDDVRVAQRGRDLAFAMEPLDDALVNLGRQEHLDGAGHLEGPMDAHVDGAHAALPELPGQVVGAEPTPGQVWHLAYRARSLARTAVRLRRTRPAMRRR